jgi:hypothetical protein
MGGRGLRHCKSPGSVVTTYWNIIYRKFLGLVPIKPLITRMSYDVKIKKYKVPHTHEKKVHYFSDTESLRSEHGLQFSRISGWNTTIPYFFEKIRD